MAEKTYALIEYKDYPNQAMKTGYYITNYCMYNIDTNPEWWETVSTSDNMLVEYNEQEIDNVLIRWSYTEDKDGVATTVTLPDINVKIPTKDNWILPLIAYSS